MIKRRDAPYLAGRPKGYWFKWKRDPMVIDAVLMYAQRGSGKRSSYYSDYTFGVWKGDELTPVGKAYFGFTDEELIELDRFVRNNTVNRFGPVREVTHTKTKGLVLEVAFEGLQRSTRHKSGVAMRFPRISRIRWDKRPARRRHAGGAGEAAGRNRSPCASFVIPELAEREPGIQGIVIAVRWLWIPDRAPRVRNDETCDWRSNVSLEARPRRNSGAHPRRLRRPQVPSRRIL